MRAETRTAHTDDEDPDALRKERIFIGLMTPDRKFKASRGGSKERIYGTCERASVIEPTLVESTLVRGKDAGASIIQLTLVRGRTRTTSTVRRDGGAAERLAETCRHEGVSLST